MTAPRIESMIDEAAVAMYNADHPRSGEITALDQIREDYADGLRRQARVAFGTYSGAMRKWVIRRWIAEVGNRPLENIHRRTLDGVWRQVYGWLNDQEFPFLTHDELLVAGTVEPSAYGHDET